MVLAINLVSTAIALRQRGSIFLPVIPNSRHIPLTVLVVLAGLTGLISVCLTQRSYTSNLQLSSYGIILVVLGYLKNGQRYQSVQTEDHVGISATLETDECSDGQHTNFETSPPYIRGPCTLSNAATIQAAIAAGIWGLFLLQNFTGRLVQYPVLRPPVLDRTFRPIVPLRIVLSMYEEPLYAVESLIATLRHIPALANADVFIYTKSQKISAEGIKQGTGAHQVIQLPNLGREGETYLHHILSQWDSLANHTLFMQANIHNRREVILRLETYFDPLRTGMLSLGFVGHVVRCYGGSDIFEWTPLGLLPDLYRCTQRAECGRVLLSYKGQFVVSATRIRGIDRTIYEELRTSLIRDQSSALVFGFTIERLWSLLFQCSNMEVASKCPSLISGVREGGDIGDCQCLDH